MEVWRSVVVGDHGLAIDQERRGLEAERGIDDGREAVGPVMAAAREASDARAIPAHHQPIAVVLDFVNPERAGRRSGYLGRQAWLDETGGQGHDRSIGQRPGGMEGFERLIRPTHYRGAVLRRRADAKSVERIYKLARMAALSCKRCHSSCAAMIEGLH